MLKSALPKDNEDAKKRTKERSPIKRTEPQITTPEEAFEKEKSRSIEKENEIFDEMFEKEKKYTFSISPLHKSLVRKSNAKGLAFELTGDQIESLLEKKCHFYGVESVTLITVGKKFDYSSSKGVCGECKGVHDLLGEGMGDYLGRFVK